MKVVGIPGGGILKFEGKRRFSKGLMQKSGKFRGGHDKIDWKSRGISFKKIDILNIFFSGKAQFFSFLDF